MADGTQASLMDAARQYLASLGDDDRMADQAEVERFVRWCGADRPCAQLRGQDVANYAETLTGTVTDASRRADAVKSFLAYAKKAGFMPANMGAHLRLRKGTAATAARGPAPKQVEMTEQQRVALTAEVESLKALRPQIVEDIQRARADKDFRENAPLDAARDQQGRVEGRIRQLQAMLDQAVIVDESRPTSGEAVDIGNTVVLRNLQSGVETRYTLVRPGEVNAAQGRISYESPVGQALLSRRAGEEVDVTVPSGTLRFRIERVEA
jgi:transcription elongation factor GreA